MLAEASRFSKVGALRAVLRTPEEFARVWRDAHAGQSSPVPPPPPVLDFTREMVIVAGLGWQAEAGHRVVIPQVRERDGVLDVTVEVHVPNAGCPGFPAVGHPTVLVRAPATQSTPVFHDRVIRSGC